MVETMSDEQKEWLKQDVNRFVEALKVADNVKQSDMVNLEKEILLPFRKEIEGGARERHGWFLRELEKLEDKNKKVLVAGCGDGEVL